MSNVTFIIGNGLDLSLGLKTSYKDFFDHIKFHKLHPENRIYQAFTENLETWVDFEVELGKYTNYISKLPEKVRKEESIKFHEELSELILDLAAYLKEQEKSVTEALTKSVFTSTSYFIELPLGQIDKIRAHVSSRPLTIQFVTLNYTGILRRVLQSIQNTLSRERVVINGPHHVHGTIIDNLTLGVSDESQLSSSMSDEEKDDLIKPRLIESMNDGRIDMLRQIIARSSVIVFFGTSIGETDKYIWELVNNWLVTSPDGYIIIHNYSNVYLDSIGLLSRKRKDFDKNIQDKILRYSGSDGDVIVELKKRIFVIHNTKMLFNAN